MARLGVAPIVLGHVANHRSTTRAGVTLAVYSQYAYDKEKRQALDLWADRLLAITGAGTVADGTDVSGAGGMEPRQDRDVAVFAAIDATVAELALSMKDGRFEGRVGQITFKEFAY